MTERKITGVRPEFAAPYGVSPTGRKPSQPDIQNMPGTLAHAFEMIAAQKGLPAFDESKALPCVDTDGHDWQLTDYHHNIETCRKCGLKDERPPC